jgi:hypothetical protein
MRQAGLRFGIAAALGWVFLSFSSAHARPVEVELLLAVDVSASVSPEEFDLQMRGYASAFRAPQFLEALKALGANGIAVSMMQWADIQQQRVSIPWMLVTDEASAEAFAAAIDGTPRQFEQGQTAIGHALDFALKLFPPRGFEGQRRVIDVSGDGYSNRGVLPNAYRDQAVKMGFTINGLVIINEERYLAGYYQRNVIGGPGAFVAVSNDFRDFAEAVLAKLVRELKGAHIAAAPPARAPAGAAVRAARAQMSSL